MADTNKSTTTGPGAALAAQSGGSSHQQPVLVELVPAQPLNLSLINPETGKRWDETVPGGVYVDGKSLKPHDAHGNALDAESLKAAGIDLSGKGKDKPKHPPYTESEWSLQSAGPAAVPQAPGEEKEPEAKEPEPPVDPGAPGRPTKAGAEAGQKAEAEAEKAAKAASHNATSKK
ncbi:MAG TPA: hypothetical protein VH539_12185 [Gemmatimonadaceae bacterium]|jgi:hypothetical protein